MAGAWLRAQAGGAAGPATDRLYPSAQAVGTAPASQPTLEAGEVNRRNFESNKLFATLLPRYDDAWKTRRDRLGRAMALLGMARIPRAEVTNRLLTVLQEERDAGLKLVAWHCLLARATGMTEPEFLQWREQTYAMMNGRQFTGAHRIGVLRVLALYPPDATAKQYLHRVFDECNGGDADDDLVLLEIARTAKTWNDPTIVDLLLQSLTRYERMESAEYILHALGCDVGWSHDQVSGPATVARMLETVPRDYLAWWQSERTHWKPAVLPATPRPWRTLRGQFVATVDFEQTPDPADLAWLADANLKLPSIPAATIGFVVESSDAGSPVAAWLRHDARRFIESLRLATPDPQVAMTVYRHQAGQYVGKTLPQTGNPMAVGSWLSTVDAAGDGAGGDSLRRAVLEHFSGARYPSNGRRSVVLVGPPPMHAAGLAETERLIKAGATRGFRVYGLKLRDGRDAAVATPDAIDTLVSAGQGSSRSGMPLHGLPMSVRAMCRGHAGRTRFTQSVYTTRLLRQVTPDDVLDPSEWIAANAVADLVSPQHTPRVQEAVRIFWHALPRPTPEKRAIPGVKG
jgi:hypothetical protein